MRVSVVIPAYRAARTIGRAVDSVFAQTHPADEIIVVDDGSPDDQAAVIEEAYGNRVTLIRQSNGKTARARNAGIDRATGDVIAFLDADDYWEPEKLAKQLEILRRFPEVGLVAGTWFEQQPGMPQVASPMARRNQSRFDRVVRARGSEAVLMATMIWTGAVLIRRAALGEERFVSGLEPTEDRDLWIRLAANHPIYLLSEPLATAVLEPGSISRSSIETDCRNTIRMFERHRDLLSSWEFRLWHSHTLYRWAAMDPNFSTSVPRLLHSLALWPLPYWPYLKGSRMGRLRRLLVLCRDRLVG